MMAAERNGGKRRRKMTACGGWRNGSMLGWRVRTACAPHFRQRRRSSGANRRR